MRMLHLSQGSRTQLLFGVWLLFTSLLHGIYHSLCDHFSHIVGTLEAG